MDGWLMDAWMIRISLERIRVKFYEDIVVIYGRGGDRMT
jgi:hypothetical protein